MLRCSLRLSLFALVAAFLVAGSNAQQPNANPKLQRSYENEACDPVAFTSKTGGKKGWKVVIPGKRPLATPAVVDGRVFLGGGFGSHEFYAFDAATGKKEWTYRTKDDGPTAAVVADGYVAFNTESCELEVLTVKGKSVWKKWLGDPLMSMPAIADGKVYMAYPNSKGDRKHYLACFDLKNDGKELWKHEIAGEVITAPVIDHGEVFLATLEGTLYCFKADGDLVWQEKKNATSAPIIFDGECYFSCRTTRPRQEGAKTMTQQEEALARRGGKAKDQAKEIIITRRPADYLDSNKRANSQIENQYQALDAGVGFNAANKADAKIKQAMDNLGQNSVVGVWSYQGSRPWSSAIGSTARWVIRSSASISRRRRSFGSSICARRRKRANCSTRC